MATKSTTRRSVLATQNCSINAIGYLQQGANTFISKEKDDMFMWIFKFAPRKKLGMLLLCFVSIAVMLWILYVGKGEVTHEVVPIRNLGFINISTVVFSGYSPASVDEIRTQEYDDTNVTTNNVKRITPPIYFTGYALPPGNPCETFTLPPPPADKKRIGPRPCPVCYLSVEEAIALMPKAPSYSPVIQNLTYVHKQNSTKTEFGGSEFGGYPSLKQRIESYDVKE